MKLTITLALVTLALLCSPASADICPGFAHVIENLLLGTPSSYETSLKEFQPDNAMKDAGMQMKKVLDTLPQTTRENIIKLTEKIVKSPLCT